MSDECRAPRSVTNVFNYALAASQFSMEHFTLGPTSILVLSKIPADGFFLLFLDHVPQVFGTDYTVDADDQTVTIIGGTSGQAIDVVYIGA